ncbi:hypothetical protein SALBM311S_01310 [Streptomyces alboniger]
MLPFLTVADIRGVIGPAADQFPDSLLALDTAGPGVVDLQDQHDASSKVEARMRRPCAESARLGRRQHGVQDSVGKCVNRLR